MKMKKKVWGKVLLFMLLSISLLTIYAGAHESDPVWELPEPVYLGEDPNGGDVVLQGTPDMAGAVSELRTGIAKVQGEIDIAKFGIPVERRIELRDELYNNCPELFHFSGGWSYFSSNNIVTKVIPDYIMSSSEYAQARAIYDRELNYIVGLVDESWSNLEKVLFVHDYLAANYEYDLTYTIRDAYQFFVRKTGVCQAYTLAYTAVLQKLDIEVSYVSSNNLNHIWNVVKLNGSWYHVDVTHDDPITDRIGYARHVNFLRSDSGLEGHDVEGKERDWEYGISDRCTDTTYDTYFWAKANSPFTNVDRTWYFIESDIDGNYITASRLMKWDGGNGSANETMVEGFKTPGTGLGYFAGKLYFNSFDDLYSYDLQMKSLEKLLRADSRIYGSRLEKSADGAFLKYGQLQDSSMVIEEYTIDPYETVAEGGYAYYQNDGSVYIKLDESSCVVVAWYNKDSKMLGVNVFTNEGTWSVAPGIETKKIQIIAVQDVTQWVAKCAARSLVA